MSLSDEENLDISKKEDGSDAEEGSVAGSETGSEGKSDIGGEEDAVAGVDAGVDDEDVAASDIDESEGEGDGEGGLGGEDEEPPSFASGLKKMASASNKLLSNIQDVVSNVGASAGSGEDLLSKFTTSVKMPSSRGRRKKNAQATTSTFEEEGLEQAEEEEGGGGNDSDEDDINTKLKKFDKELRDNYLLNFHPESLVQNYDEIYNLARVVRDDNGIVVDELHRTLPMLTKYEKSRVLGQRAKQINDGATPFVKVPEGVIDGYLIAMMELEQKKIPFIIRRPLPNGGSEYWHLEDLEIIN
jgi:DNA-directed RNA polymerase I, II, and III subunit RPABC2